MFGFEKLDVWQQSIEYANCVYDVTRQFPTDERFGLTSQLRRSAVSVSSNIAAGSGRGSNPDFARFVGISYGSLLESVSQFHIAQRQQFLAQAAFDNVYQRAEHVARMLSGLKNSLERRQG